LATILLAMADMKSSLRANGRLRRADIDWNKALAEHESWLRTVVLARVGEPQAVDEVVQEIALGAVKDSSPLNDPTKVAPWLYRLAIRHTLLYRRRRGRERKLVDRYATRYQPSEMDRRTPNPLAWLLAEEQDAMVREALDRLPRRDREILLLKYVENWSYHQMSQHLGISHSAVEARLYRARQRLRRDLTRMKVVER
jgi:RNA polymerase sigma-70 factor (ECF subfamily)